MIRITKDARHPFLRICNVRNLTNAWTVILVILQDCNPKTRSLGSRLLFNKHRCLTPERAEIESVNLSDTSYSELHRIFTKSPKGLFNILC